MFEIAVRHQILPTEKDCPEETWKVIKNAGRAYSKNFGQHLILVRECIFLMGKGHFFLKKGPKNLIPPPILFNPFSKFLHQNKALHDLRKKGQRSIVEGNIGLEYTLAGLFYQINSKGALVGLVE